MILNFFQYLEGVSITTIKYLSPTGHNMHPVDGPLVCVMASVHSLHLAPGPNGRRQLIRINKVQRGNETAFHGVIKFASSSRVSMKINAND